MEDFLRPIYQERASQHNTLGILIIEKRVQEGSITDNFDIVLFVIVEKDQQPIFVKHYQFDNKKTALYVVEKQLVDEWLIQGSNRKVIDWLLNGQIIFERNDVLENIQQQLKEFPIESRKMKIGLEFAKLIRRYVDGRGFFENHQYLDAYNHIVHALHHLARVVVINHGFHPEVTVWNQVKRIDPEIHKLYQELVESEETLEKRLQLLFLANEFLIHNHIKEGAEHLLEILAEKEDAWSISEMMDHPKLNMYSVDLSVMVEYLIEKHCIFVKEVETKEKGIYQRHYYVE